MLDVCSSMVLQDMFRSKVGVAERMWALALAVGRIVTPFRVCHDCLRGCVWCMCA
jgi:hypothetical protein